MLQPKTPAAPATASSTIRMIIPAEMINNTAVPAVIQIGGSIFKSLTPRNPAEAASFNKSVYDAGGEAI